MGLLADQSHSMAGSIPQTQTGLSGDSVLSGKGGAETGYGKSWKWGKMFKIHYMEFSNK